MTHILRFHTLNLTKALNSKGGLQDFCWSPAAPIMAVYQVETAGGNLPARISLMRMPHRVELRQKNLFSVADVQMFWHPQGDYLAVQARHRNTPAASAGAVGICGALSCACCVCYCC